MLPQIFYSPSIDCIVYTSLDGLCAVYDFKNDELSSIVLEETSKTDKKVDHEAKGAILAGGFSSSGKHFVLCNDYKQVFLYSTGDAAEWKLISIRDTPKKCVQLVFLDDESSFLVADRFGDVLQLSCVKPEQEASVVLGHLSMLMDITLLSNNTLLATADRDEKIRISCYPNTYNIQSFCLGHSTFVTSLVEVSNDLLASSSGDGTVKLWKTQDGILMSEIKLPNDLFAHKLYFNTQSSVIICLMCGEPEVILLRVSSNTLTMDSSRRISAAGMNMCRFNDGYLILTDNAESPFEYLTLCPDEHASVKGEVISKLNEHVKCKWTSFEDVNRNLVDFYANLSKMNFDNIEEHMERKGKRPPAHIEKQEAPDSKTSKLTV